MTQTVVVMFELDEARLSESGFYSKLVAIPGSRFVCSWYLKEKDPDIVGETLSYILTDPEDING